jgi:hypothetical protein
MKISRILNIFAMAVLFLMANGGAWAQSSDQAEQAAPAPPHGGGPMFERMGPMAEGMGFVAFEAGLDGKTVTGAPFTASFSEQTGTHTAGYDSSGDWAMGRSGKNSSAGFVYQRSGRGNAVHAGS